MCQTGAAVLRPYLGVNCCVEAEIANSQKENNDGYCDLTKPAAKVDFLLESPLPGDVFTPGLTDDQKLLDRRRRVCVVKEVLPLSRTLGE